MPATVVIDVYPEEIPGVIRQQVAEVANDISRFPYSRVLEDDILPWVRKLHESYFKTESDPSGKPWRPLAPSTVAKKGHDTILVDKQRLMRSLTTRSVYSISQVRGNELTYGTADPHSRFHQFGAALAARTSVGRQMAGMRRRIRTDMVRFIPRSRSLADVRTSGGIGRIPERPHVGLSGKTSSEAAERLADAVVKRLSA